MEEAGEGEQQEEGNEQEEEGRMEEMEEGGSVRDRYPNTQFWLSVMK